MFQKGIQKNVVVQLTPPHVKNRPLINSLIDQKNNTEHFWEFVNFSIINGL